LKHWIDKQTDRQTDIMHTVLRAVQTDEWTARVTLEILISLVPTSDCTRYIL